jgi:HAE1 family hydrophobic/amphiphilic exporter-1
MLPFYGSNIWEGYIIMSWLTKWSFKNKAAVSIMSLLILLMGVISYFRLPMEFLPPADQPFISIVTIGHGVDANTMEDQVSTVIEEAVVGVKGKKNIFSTTGDGFSKVDVHLDSKADKKASKQEIVDSLAMIPLPQNVMKPNVVLLNTSQIPVSEVSLVFDNGLTPKNIEYANREILPYLKEIKGISSVQTFGNTSSYVSIKIDNLKLAKNNVQLQSIFTLLKEQNLSVPIAQKNVEGKASNIKVVGNVPDLESLKSLPVGQNTKLSDIAEVTITKPSNTLARINGKEGLFLIISKDSNSNAVDINRDVTKQINKINKKFDDVEADVIFATADMVENSVNSMMKEVLLGALFATIVIMLFLRNIRSTLITIVSIPLSLAFTLYLLRESGVTLNILTLGGVAVAVGRLVDDSIVVIENIFRKTQKEKLSKELIIEATREVGSAITSSTITTVAVFLPLGLVNGGLQEFLLPFALTVTYSLLASLVVALTVVPLMSYGLLKNTTLKPHKRPEGYIKTLKWSLNHKWVVLLTSFVLFAGSIGSYIVLPKGAVTDSQSELVSVVLKYPSDTPIEKVKEEALELDQYINNIKEVKHSILQLGANEESAKYGQVSSASEPQFTVILKEKKDVKKIVKKIKTQSENYPAAELNVSEASMMGGSNTSITIDILGENLNKLENTSKEVINEIENIKGVKTVESNMQEKKTVYSLVVDPKLAKADQIAQQTAFMLNQTPIGKLNIENQTLPVLLEPMYDIKNVDDINNIPIMTPMGMSPVSKLVTLDKEEVPTNTFHKDGEQYVRVTASVDPEKLSVISADINKKLFGEKGKGGLDVEDGIKLLVGGASADQADDFTDLYMTMLVSIGLVFLIMVITFKTIRAPIAILFSLPLAAIGAILGLIVSGIPVDITSLLGALMLIGVVVTNAIVLLDKVKQNEENMIIRDALVEAAATRIRPIIMTAVATICAMLPLLFKEAEVGNLVSANLAVVVIGGLTVATLLTLVVIPVVYELLHFKKAKKQLLEQIK